MFDWASSKIAPLVDFKNVDLRAKGTNASMLGMLLLSVSLEDIIVFNA